MKGQLLTEHETRAAEVLYTAKQSRKCEVFGLHGETFVKVSIKLLIDCKTGTRRFLK